MDTFPSSVRVSETQAQTESVMRLVEISAGYWLPRALQVVADLAIADALDQSIAFARFAWRLRSAQRQIRAQRALSCTAQRPSAINARLCTACRAARVLEELGSA